MSDVALTREEREAFSQLTGNLGPVLRDAANVAVRRERRERRGNTDVWQWLMAAAALVVALLALSAARDAGATAGRAEARYQVSEAVDEQQQADIDANSQTVADLIEQNKRLEAQGKTPVPVPDVAPGADIDPEAMAALITAKVLASIPTPEDGHTPTTDELLPLMAVVAAEYIAANPAPAGADGHTPTMDELVPVMRSVADAYFAANPPPPGQDGEPGQDGADGAAGRGISSGPDAVISDGGECVLRTTYDNGDVYDSAPINPIVCIPPD